MKIKILGYKAKIDNIDDFLKIFNDLKEKNLSYKNSSESIIQVFDAKAIAGEKHLNHAILHALNAFERNENLANDLGIEISIRLSAQRQISKALNIVGVKKGEMDICVLMMNCPYEFEDKLNLMFKRDDSVLESNPLILKEIYNISDEQMDMMCIEDILIDETTTLLVKS